MVEAHLINARKHGMFAHEMRCQCPANKVMATKFSKVKTQYTDKYRRVCCWLVLIISIILFVALAVLMLVEYNNIEKKDFTLYLLHFASILIITIITSLVFLCCYKSYFERRHTALEVLYNCESCGHNVHRTYECFIYYYYVHHANHHSYRYYRNKTYSPWGQYTATNVTKTVLQKPRAMTTIEAVEREFDMMSGANKDDYRTSWAWTVDLMNRLN
ncbi:hypothetical protein niasHS_001125 [Heterodera schachtii]|uniref:Uncharacterized protein n=1 Tax=Heterodera schachtii TaxID=97005 RepID=A0ABD2KCB3_HETSC